MQQTDCEFLIWNGLPVIRREIAECMINKFGLSQKETAQKLGITPAAVCQYVSKKRGKNDITDDIFLKEIKISAERIVKDGDRVVIKETCRICKIMRNNGCFYK